MEKNNKKCPVFDICGAAIIRQYFWDKNWQNIFCQDNFKECPHYEVRSERGEKQ